MYVLVALEVETTRAASMENLEEDDLNTQDILDMPDCQACGGQVQLTIQVRTPFITVWMATVEQEFLVLRVIRMEESPFVASKTRSDVNRCFIS